MAHFAQIDENNVVVQVLVVPDAQEDRGQEFLADDLNLGGIWKKTSYNTTGGVHANGGTPYRKNYAGIGYTYDAARDAFIPPKPFASWILNEATCLWDAPVAYPTDGKIYTWNEDTTSWDEVTND
jgi:hypothetical protein